MDITMANRDPLLEEVKDEFEYCTQKCKRYKAMFPGNRKYHDATCKYKKFLSASPQIQVNESTGNERIAFIKERIGFI